MQGCLLHCTPHHRKRTHVKNGWRQHTHSLPLKSQLYHVLLSWAASLPRIFLTHKIGLIFMPHKIVRTKWQSIWKNLACTINMTCNEFSRPVWEYGSFWPKEFQGDAVSSRSKSEREREREKESTRASENGLHVSLVEPWNQSHLHGLLGPWLRQEPEDFQAWDDPAKG